MELCADFRTVGGGQRSHTYKNLTWINVWACMYYMRLILLYNINITIQGKPQRRIRAVGCRNFEKFLRKS